MPLLTNFDVLMALFSGVRVLDFDVLFCMWIVGSRKAWKARRQSGRAPSCGRIRFLECWDLPCFRARPHCSASPGVFHLGRAGNSTAAGSFCPFRPVFRAGVVDKYARPFGWQAAFWSRCVSRPWVNAVPCSRREALAPRQMPSSRMPRLRAATVPPSADSALAAAETALAKRRPCPIACIAGLLCVRRREQAGRPVPFRRSAPVRMARPVPTCA